MTKQRNYLMISIVSILLLTIGLSVAYFTVQIEGEGKTISVDSANLKVIFTDNETISVNNVKPGWQTSKTFSVESQTDELYYYNIKIDDLLNTLETRFYLQYKIVSAKGFNTVSNDDNWVVVPNMSSATDTVIAYNIPLAVGDTHEYTIYFRYVNNSYADQSGDMNKRFTGKIAIEKGTEATLVNKMMLDNNALETSKVPERTNFSKAYYGNDKLCYYGGQRVIDFAASDASTGTLAYATESTCTSTPICNTDLGPVVGLNEQYCAAVAQQMGIESEYTGAYATWVEDEVKPTFFKTNNAEHGDTVYYYAGDADNNWVVFGKQEVCTYNGAQVIDFNASDTSTGTLVYATESTCTSTPICNSDLGPVVGLNEQYCAAVAQQLNINSQWLEDTYATWNEADLYWRIIRTNENATGGGVRLLYSGSGLKKLNGKTVIADNVKNAFIALDTPFNAYDENSEGYNTHLDRYVGYMYGTSGYTLANIRENTTDSTIKTVIDDWYEETFVNANSGLASKISTTAVYCNDRSYTNDNWFSSEGMNNSFGAYGRLSDAKAPSYACGANTSGYGSYFTGGNDKADKFSSEETTYGNGLLAYPVALMTADEVAFAGGKRYAVNQSAWYRANNEGNSITGINYWWLLSPDYANNIDARVLVVRGNDGAFDTGNTRYGEAVRPSLSLKSDTPASGSGTANDPYIIK